MRSRRPHEARVGSELRGRQGPRVDGRALPLAREEGASAGRIVLAVGDRGDHAREVRLALGQEHVHLPDPWLEGLLRDRDPPAVAQLPVQDAPARLDVARARGAPVLGPVHGSACGRHEAPDNPVDEHGLIAR
eukprot:scaffold3140_cov175-Pinguiococcus_pyrenoidosus.AAC.1